jgi:hypothetical protein
MKQFLVCDLSFDDDDDAKNKRQTLQDICRTIQQTPRNKTGRDIQLKYCRTVGVPTLLHGCKTWSVMVLN